MLSRSTDGGETWSRGIQLTAAHNNAASGGRQGCDMRTDSTGTLYVFMTDSASHQEAIKETRSYDGGKSFEKPFVVTYETNPGGPSVVSPGENDNYDGVAGARSDDFPHVSIANGAPSGAGAPDTISLTWADGSDGLDAEHVYLMLSQGGSTWSGKSDLQALGDRGLMPSGALSPNGQDLYVTYDGVLDPFRTIVGDPLDPEHARRFQPVVRHADVAGTSISNLATLFRGGVGDGRASSANSLVDEFLGDYNMVSATNSGAVAVYITAQDADQCAAINDYRDQLVDAAGGGGAAGAAPAPASCGNRFGNTDIRGYVASHPTASATAARTNSR
jgi:hypothetical protein